MSSLTVREVRVKVNGQMMDLEIVRQTAGRRRQSSYKVEHRGLTVAHLLPEGQGVVYYESRCTNMQGYTDSLEDAFERVCEVYAQQLAQRRERARK